MPLQKCLMFKKIHRKNFWQVGQESDTTEQLHFHFSLLCTGEGNGNPLQCSCLENPRDGGPWWAAVCGVAQSRTRMKRLSSSRTLSMSVSDLQKDQGGHHVWLFVSGLRKTSEVWETGTQVFGEMDNLYQEVVETILVDLIILINRTVAGFSSNCHRIQFSCSVIFDSATPWIAACQASLSVTNSRSSLRLTSIESVMPSSHLILCHPLSSCPQSLPASESFPMSQLFTTELVSA